MSTARSLIEQALAQREGKLLLNLGCGNSPLEGFLNIDLSAGENILQMDLENEVDKMHLELTLEEMRVPVSEIRMSHLIEHLREPLRMMQWLWRISAPDAACIILCPHGASDDAWADPTHIRPYFPDSFHFFGQPAYWRADYGYTADWEVIGTTLDILPKFCNSSQAELIDLIMHSRNVVEQMRVLLRARKPVRPRIKLERMPSIALICKGEKA